MLLTGRVSLSRLLRLPSLPVTSPMPPAFHAMRQCRDHFRFTDAAVMVGVDGIEVQQLGELMRTLAACGTVSAHSIQEDLVF